MTSSRGPTQLCCSQVDGLVSCAREQRQTHARPVVDIAIPAGYATAKETNSGSRSWSLQEAFATSFPGLVAGV